MCILQKQHNLSARLHSFLLWILHTRKCWLKWKTSFESVNKLFHYFQVFLHFSLLLLHNYVFSQVPASEPAMRVFTTVEREFGDYEIVFGAGREEVLENKWKFSLHTHFASVMTISSERKSIESTHRQRLMWCDDVWHPQKTLALIQSICWMSTLFSHGWLIVGY